MAKLYMIAETSEFMMSFVIATEKNNCIVIDGGRPMDMPSLKEVINGRHISAWILTHPHSDHISGFIDEMEKNSGSAFDIEAVYYNFPSYNKLIDNHDVPDYAYFRSELEETLPSFINIEDRFSDIAHHPVRGDTIDIDEIHIEFLFSVRDGLYANLMNDSSLVFKITTKDTSVLFMGDLGPDAGDILFRESGDKLKSDIVQMAHHGHMNVSMEVYAAIKPDVCLWCAPDWLYDEPMFPSYLSDNEKMIRMGRTRMYGTALTRQWMDILGVKKHYVTKDGTQIIQI